MIVLSILPTVGDAAIDTSRDTTMAYCGMGSPAKEEAIAPSVHSICTGGQTPRRADADVGSDAAIVSPIRAATVKRFMVRSSKSV
jgi:hypothetical protein